MGIAYHILGTPFPCLLPECAADGTAADTRLEIDLAAGATGSSPTDLTLADDRLSFVADDGVSGWQLWVMDPVTP